MKGTTVPGIQGFSRAPKISFCRCIWNKWGTCSVLELWGKLTCSILFMVQDNKEEICALREEPEWREPKVHTLVACDWIFCLVCVSLGPSEYRSSWFWSDIIDAGWSKSQYPQESDPVVFSLEGLQQLKNELILKEIKLIRNFFKVFWEFQRQGC